MRALSLEDDFCEGGKQNLRLLAPRYQLHSETHVFDFGDGEAFRPEVQHELEGRPDDKVVVVLLVRDA